jgi:pimeloyl-ACP methyl ester carboxylesterase
MQLEVVTREPEGAAKSTPILFVHGAWHGAWCWEDNFLPYFAEHGYRASALSLRGHGKSESPKRFRLARINQYVDDVAQVAARFDTPPIIVGHSMGGQVAQRYLESHPAPAAILLASVPPRGVLRTTLKVAVTHPIAFTHANLTWKLYPIIGSPRRARKLLFSRDLPQDQLARNFARLQNEAYLAYLDMIVFSLPHPRRVRRRNTPVLVLGGDRDAIFTVREARRTARAYRTEAKIFPGMAHDMMLEPGWRDVADTMLAWLTSRGL